MLNKLINLTPRKLPLAMFMIAISTMAAVIIFLFKSKESVSSEMYVDCKKELAEIRNKYYKLSEESRSEISTIYIDVIKDIKETNKNIANEMQEIKKKRDNVRKKQQYLDDVLEKLKTVK